VDIGYAKISLTQSKNEDIKKLAQTMSDDHFAIIKQAVGIVTKPDVTPKDNTVSQKLLSDTVKPKNTLLSKSVEAFDQPYMDNEVFCHKVVINAIDGLLIPQIKNAELKELLQNDVPALKEHLAHAEMVQNTFKKNNGTGKMDGYNILFTLLYTY
jgi:putative membrane protein